MCSRFGSASALSIVNMVQIYRDRYICVKEYIGDLQQVFADRSQTQPWFCSWRVWARDFPLMQELVDRDI
jgi:hypothetical protein